MDSTILIGLSEALGIGVAVTIAGSVLSGIANHMRLVRLDNRDFTIDALPPVLKETGPVNLDLDREIASVIEEFTEKLSAVPHIDLSGFYHNYAPYRIKEESNPHFNKYGYNINEGMIVFNPQRDLRRHLIPALMDMAATYKTENIDAVGFMRTTKDSFDRIGSFLHTTYEAILVSRYFDIKFASERDLRLAITLFIEEIVGRDLMERAFFTGALDQVVEKLSTYGKEEDVIKTIRELDHLRTAINGKSRISKLLSVYAYRDAVLKLSKMFVEKLQTEPSFNSRERITLLQEFILKQYVHGFIRYTTTENMVSEIEKSFVNKPNNLISRGGL